MAPGTGTAQIQVRLLNGFAVTAAGEPVAIRPGSQRVVAFLALAGRPGERRYTAFRLWPDKPEERAMADLRSAVWRLRQLPVELVQATANRLRLVDELWIDVHHNSGPTGDGGAPAGLELLPDW